MVGRLVGHTLPAVEFMMNVQLPSPPPSLVISISLHCFIGLRRSQVKLLGLPFHSVGIARRCSRQLVSQAPQNVTRNTFLYAESVIDAYVVIGMVGKVVKPPNVVPR